jgi:hypothetical protein
MKTERMDGKLGLLPYFDIRHSYDVAAVRSTSQPHFTPKETSWYTFTLEAEWNPGLLIADRSNWSLENFQGSYWELKQEPPVLWRCT